MKALAFISRSMKVESWVSLVTVCLWKTFIWENNEHIYVESEKQMSGGINNKYSINSQAGRRWDGYFPRAKLKRRCMVIHKTKVNWIHHTYQNSSGAKARGPTIYYLLWATLSHFLSQILLFHRKKKGKNRINQSQTHKHNPQCLSKKEIIIFEVMRVLPEEKGNAPHFLSSFSFFVLLSFASPVSWSKKNIGRQTHICPSLPPLPPPPPPPPQNVLAQLHGNALELIRYLQAMKPEKKKRKKGKERKYNQGGELCESSEKGSSGQRHDGRKLRWFKPSFSWHLSGPFQFLLW